MSSIPSIRIASVIPLANPISTSVASGSGGSNPVSSSSESTFLDQGAENLAKRNGGAPTIRSRRLKVRHP
jgi:hypothetical protein